MTIPFFQVDAFTSRVFGGNPAAVCPLDSWLDDAVLQAIAMENNLAETAYFVPMDDGRYHLRWFTPKTEVDLCGHATLAAALVLMEQLKPGLTEVAFDSRSGELRVTKEGDTGLYALDFPATPGMRIPANPTLYVALGGVEPLELWQGKLYHMAVYETVNQVRSLAPDMRALGAIPDVFAVVATAASDSHEADFVSRFFAPAAGIDEDPVTGSAHCMLVPYWSEKLGKPDLFAQQISARGGDLYCANQGDRVRIAGRGVLFASGAIHL